MVCVYVLHGFLSANSSDEAFGTTKFPEAKMLLRSLVSC
jgi:hypothetical protein